MAITRSQTSIRPTGQTVLKRGTQSGPNSRPLRRCVGAKKNQCLRRSSRLQRSKHGDTAGFQHVENELATLRTVGKPSANEPSEAKTDFLRVPKTATELVTSIYAGGGVTPTGDLNSLMAGGDDRRYCLDKHRGWKEKGEPLKRHRTFGRSGYGSVTDNTADDLGTTSHEHLGNGTLYDEKLDGIEQGAVSWCICT